MDESTYILITAVGAKSAEPTMKGAQKISKDVFKFRPPNPSDARIDPELTKIIGKKETLGRPSFTSNPTLWRNWMFETLKRKLSGIIQKFKDLVGLQEAKLSEPTAQLLHPYIQEDYADLFKLAQKMKSRFRKETFSENLLLLHPGLRKNYQGLGKLVEEDKSLIDGKIDALIEDVQKHLPESNSFDLLSDKQKVAALKKTIHNLRQIYVEDQKALEISEKSTSETLKFVPRFLSWQVNGPDALQIFGKKMSIYQSCFLAQDKKSLQMWLSPNQKYLSKSFALLGPEGVLKIWLEKAIMENNQFKRLGLSGNKHDFVTKLEYLQGSLADLAYMDHDSGLYQPGSTMESKVAYQNKLKEIVGHEEKLIDILGSRDKLKEALEMITKLDFHKEFMQELKTPKSMTGYKVQFLNPWGQLRKYNPRMDPLYKELGLPSTESNSEEFNQWNKLLLKDVTYTLDVFVEREREEKNLKEILKPQRLKRLSKYLENSANVSPLE
ncbi:hypothetical protein PCASD_01399 [Puccinia coronata f. sp. avenae]|uniref:Uncharacterized protein n=1 Tax=Puccinia coronata f. sp. avenae TaxID=200324 RepID=A0A2N5VKQ5_9BASI|nr:hypothetical protein PCASD_01399 [Puccinia coronata f. sp. avenae]